VRKIIPFLGNSARFYLTHPTAVVGIRYLVIRGDDGFVEVSRKGAKGS
jgi:hypothetical protein